MSRYAYGYSVAPARPTGWRSAFGNFIGMTAVVLLSAISGVVVAYELIGGDARFLSTPVSSAAVAPAPTRVEAAIQAPAKLSAKAATTGSAAPGIQPAATIAAPQSPKPAPRAEAPATVAAAPAAAPQAAPSAPAPSAPIASNDDAAIPASDLTFAKGYALRRAARQAAAQAASPKAAAGQTATANSKVAAASDEPGAAVEKQFGRPAVVAKRKPSAMAQYPRGERYGMFERFEGPARHQALAFGDSSPQRPVRRSGGWFDGLF